MWHTSVGPDFAIPKFRLFPVPPPSPGTTWNGLQKSAAKGRTTPALLHAPIVRRPCWTVLQPLQPLIKTVELEGWHNPGLAALERQHGVVVAGVWREARQVSFCETAEGVSDDANILSLPRAVLRGGGGIRNANRNERSRGRSQDMGKTWARTQDHRNSIEQWLTVGSGWRLAISGW